VIILLLKTFRLSEQKRGNFYGRPLGTIPKKESFCQVVVMGKGMMSSPCPNQ